MKPGVALVKRPKYHCEMEVSRRVSPHKDLRANQKERTREALVGAARALLRGGTPPTVAEAAEEARVSRATAYRYFPTHESLMVEIANVTPATQPVEQLLDNLTSDDAEERLLSLLDKFNPIVFAEEIPMRTALRTYLDTWLESRGKGDKAIPVREGRRMRWLDKVLEPVRRDLTEAQRRRLRAALALTLSIDAMVVMKDVCRIEGEKEALEVLRWAASALLRAGLDEAKAKRRAKRAARA
jgi:AcrR family transcriptional regulator